MQSANTWQSLASGIACTRCGAHLPLGRAHNLCACGGPLSVGYALEGAAASLPRPAVLSAGEGIWSFRALLPVQSAAGCVSLGEGGTPLLPLVRLGSRLGSATLWLKDESLNPTNSFKARGMAVAVSRARELGLEHLAIPSAGNAGCALAAYAARAGLRASVFVPADIPAPFVTECEAHGADVERVPGLISDCAARVQAGCTVHGWFDVSTLKEPYRLEGKKTLGFELAVQCAWQLPDVVIYPTGGGTGLIGMWKAFDEMEALGWIDARRPRLVTVQAAGCAPLVRAFDDGAERGQPWARAQTIALGLRVPAAVGDFLVLRALRASGGTALAVSDAAIAAAGRELAREEGIFAAPEGAACWAAALELRDRNWLRGGERVVLFNTGGWYKYGDAWRAALGL